MTDATKLRVLMEAVDMEEQRDGRRITTKVIEWMDEGMLDPRAVADAAMQYMPEDEVADMASDNSWFGEDDEDTDFDESQSSGMRTMIDEIENSDTKDKWGFDLTDISGEKWIEMLNMIDASTTPEQGEKSGWYWRGQNVLVVSGNNPITGEYHNPESRSPEKGYASYIGIEGEADLVSEVADFIRANADEIKDEEPHERGFI